MSYTDCSISTTDSYSLGHASGAGFTLFRPARAALSVGVVGGDVVLSNNAGSNVYISADELDRVFRLMRKTAKSIA